MRKTSASMLLPTAKGDQLMVRRPLVLSERMAVLAAAISIDCDFFSRHGSLYGGWLHMLIPYPVPPLPSGGAEAAAEAAGAAEAPASSEAAASSGASSGVEAPLDDGDFSPDSFDGELLEDGVPGAAAGAAATGGALAAIAEMLGL